MSASDTVQIPRKAEVVYFLDLGRVPSAFLDSNYKIKITGGVRDRKQRDVG